MLKRLKTISSILLLAALVASCGSGGKKNPSKDIQGLEAEKKEILAAYEQLLTPDHKESSIETRELEWEILEKLPYKNLVEKFGSISTGVYLLQKDIASGGIDLCMYNIINPNLVRKFKSGEELAGLEKELAWFKLLKQKCKYKLKLTSSKQ